MAGIQDYSTSAENNTSLFPEGMSPAAVNNRYRDGQVDLRTWYNDSEWVEIGKGSGAGDGSSNYEITYIGSDQFTVATDVTSYYNVGRKIRMTVDSGGYIYGTIAASSFGGTSTAVTVDWLSTALSVGDLRAWLGADSGDSDTTALSGAAFDGQDMSPRLLGPTETVQSIAIASNTATFSVANGGWVQIVLNANIATWTVTWPAGASSVFVQLTQDGTGGRTVAWPAAWKWPDGIEPAMTVAAGSVDLYAVASPDGGSTVFAQSAGKAYA